MRVLGTVSLLIGLWDASAPAGAAEAGPEAGSAKLAAYLVCRPLAAVDLGALGSQAATECNGVVRNSDQDKAPDNLAIHCLEDTGARLDAYRYSGACVQTDSDGDKIYLTYEGSKSGQVKWIGGTGKYKGVNGAGNLNVVVAPAGSPSLFAYTLSYDVNWIVKGK